MFTATTQKKNTAEISGNSLGETIFLEFAYIDSLWEPSISLTTMQHMLSGNLKMPMLPVVILQGQIRI